MKKMTTIMLCVLLTAGMIGCSDSDGVPAETYSVSVTSIELENKDNGQAIDAGSQSITGSVWIEE